MKRKLIASILGIAACAAAMSSHGQGYIMFENYITDARISFQGTPLNGNTWTASLYYGLGTLTDPSQLKLLGPEGAYGNDVYPTPFGDAPYLDGYFLGGNVKIPDYVSGPITFMVAAYKNSGPMGGSSYETSLIRGASDLFTLDSIATGIYPPGGPGPGLQPFGLNELQPFALQIVPEPSTYLMTGLGLAAFLILGPRRRKNRH